MVATETASSVQKRMIKENILIVEDDLDTAQSLVITLAAAGYGVRAVESRDAAVAILDRYIYQVVIMDYFMPGMSIDEFMKITMPRHTRMEIVITTAGENAEKKS